MDSWFLIFFVIVCVVTIGTAAYFDIRKPARTKTCSGAGHIVQSPALRIAASLTDSGEPGVKSTS